MSALSILIHLLAAALGSVPVGYLMAKARGVDIRSVGSGNIGATNVGRALGKKAGMLTLALDAGKGAIACSLAPLSAAAFSRPDLALYAPTLGMLAVLGHCFSPFLNFRGGKGVATAAGAFAVVAPLETLTAAAVFVLALLVFRYVSLASIGAALSLTAVSAIRHTWEAENLIIPASVVVSAVIIIRHRGNILRLREGTEPRLGSQALN